MQAATIEGLNEARLALAAHTSPRAHYLAQLKSYVEGNQYAGLADWFSADKPLFERAPCFVYPIVQNAIDSNLDLLLGDERWPEFRSIVDDEQGETDKEDSDDTFDAIIEAHKQARFKVVAREAFQEAQSCGSACAVFGVRNAKLRAETIEAEKCEPEFDVDGDVTSLRVQYPYFEDYQDESGTWRRRTMLYRRIINAVGDLVFKPVEVRQGMRPSKEDWVVDEDRSNPAHGLGFCPVVWYAHMKGCSNVATVDGKALHRNLLDEVRAHDFAISQRHRAALTCGDPQWVETGVKRGYAPTATGIIVEAMGTPKGGASVEPQYDAQGNPVAHEGQSHYVSRGQEKAGRKKGPGEVWQYENPSAKVALITLPPGALEAITEHARDLRVKLAESLAVVFLDAESFKYASALSGKALSLLQGRQLNRCDQYRDDFGDLFLVPATKMILNIIGVVAAEGTKALKFPRIKDILDQLQTLDEADITLKWPDYFRADVENEGKEAGTIRDDLDAGIITRKTAVKRRAPHYGIEDLDAYMDELDGERDEAQKRLHESVKNLEEMGDADEDDDAESPPPKRSGPADGEEGEPAGSGE